MTPPHIEHIGHKLTVTVKGDLTHFEIAELSKAVSSRLNADIRDLEVNLADCDIDESIALIETINWLRDVLSKGLFVTLIEPPQLLAHDLYRVGHLLPGTKLTLVRPRNEIGYA